MGDTPKFDEIPNKTLVRIVSSAVFASFFGATLAMRGERWFFIALLFISVVVLLLLVAWKPWLAHTDHRLDCAIESERIAAQKFEADAGKEVALAEIRSKETVDLERIRSAERIALARLNADVLEGNALIGIARGAANSGTHIELGLGAGNLAVDAVCTIGILRPSDESTEVQFPEMAQC